MKSSLSEDFLPTVVHNFYENQRIAPVCTAYEYKNNGQWVKVNWNEATELASFVAYGLWKLGLKKNDMAAILSTTRYEWIISDMGILTLGAVTIPVYPTLLEKNIEYILNHSESKIIFVEDDQQLKKIINIKENLEFLEKIVIMDLNDSTLKTDDIITFDELVEEGKREKETMPEKINQWLKNIKEESLATIIYTSGTTGLPKGAMISHKNIMANCIDVGSVLEREEGYYTIGYLPLSHAYERINEFGSITHRLVYAFAESLEKVGENIGEISPHLLPGVPRVYEKIYQKIMKSIEMATPLKRKIFNTARKIGEEVFAYKEQKKSVPFALQLKYKIAQKVVFEKLKSALGDRLIYGITAAAPLSPEILMFYQSLDIPLFEGYGMTECMAPATLNVPDAMKIGTVGKPLPSMKIQIASDGEILLKGPAVFMGYYKNDGETKQALDENGWLHTGDLGEIDNDGFIKITGRKKELIITAGGKNISPQEIENVFSQSRYLSHIVPYGDMKKFLTAVISPSEEELVIWAKDKGLKYDDFSQLTKLKEVTALYDSIVFELNKNLPSYETIKFYIIADHEFSIETGEITPTMKVKKKIVVEKYKGKLDSLYP